MPAISQEDVEATLNKYGYPQKFIDATDAANKDWKRLLASDPAFWSGHTALEKSVILNRRISQSICDVLSSDPHVVVTVTKNQTRLITIDDRITIGLKKLNRYGRPSRPKTRGGRSTWRNNERLKELPTFNQWINVTLGWLFNTIGEIIGVRILSEVVGREWTLSLLDRTIQVVPQTMPLGLNVPTVEPIEDEPAKYVVKPRKTKRNAERLDRATGDDQSQAE